MPRPSASAETPPSTALTSTPATMRLSHTCSSCTTAAVSRHSSTAAAAAAVPGSRKSVYDEDDCKAAQFATRSDASAQRNIHVQLKRTKESTLFKCVPIKYDKNDIDNTWYEHKYRHYASAIGYLFREEHGLMSSPVADGCMMRSETGSWSILMKAKNEEIDSQINTYSDTVDW